MNYNSIFSTYKSVTPPIRKKKYQIIPEEKEENEYDFLNFIMPTAIQSRKVEEPPEEVAYQAPPIQPIVEPEPVVETVPEPAPAAVVYNPSSLIRTDIEDLLRAEGITSVNGKSIKFGNKALRAANAKYGVKNSHHKERDPHTGNANARDISIVGGTDKDYADFRAMLLANDRVRSWFSAKNWGIINEITPAAMRRTNATGRHFHFGPDQWARRTWRGWLDNPNVNITKLF